MPEKLGIAGSGTIACGLAAVAAGHSDVVVWARSETSAARARSDIGRARERLGDTTAEERVTIATELDVLSDATYLVEAIVEDLQSKVSIVGRLGELSARSDSGTILATTTSSLSIRELAHASGDPRRFVGLHVFNPVPRMPLVEVIFPEEASATTRTRTHRLCEQIGKTAIEAPDIPGFLVNRLLFPYLFNAIRLMSDTGLQAADIDCAMKLGAGMPTGPIALLDYIGLDVSHAIGESIGLDVPARLAQLVSDGAFGRKASRGFYDYEREGQPAPTG